MTINDLNNEFNAHAGKLKSYLLRITASAMDAEDILQDAYLKAAENIATFKGASGLKTWIFAIATNLAKDNLRAKKRWPENVTDMARASALTDNEFFERAMYINATSPHGRFEAKEHIAFCFTCISKTLPLEQQLCIFLKDVYEFKLAEIASIINITEAMVKYYLNAGRAKMISIFDGRCALINKQGVCHQCSELSGVFNPKQDTQQELMKIDLVKQADRSSKKQLFNLRTKILRELDPFNSNASELQLHHLEYNRQLMEKYPEKNPD
jgi:RNA polymerase sigma-70 factor (ECF subfamily)